MNDLFTSRTACNSVASRTFRELHRDNLAFAEKLKDLIFPIAKRILRKGKLARGDVAPIVRDFVHQLMETPNVLEIDSPLVLRSALSTQQSRNVRFIVMNSNEDKWVHFNSCEVSFSRQRVILRASATEVRVRSHALSRFLQRQQMPISQFFEGVMDTLQAASIIGPSTFLSEHSNLALPFRDGLLLGQAHFVPVADYAAPYPMVITYDRGGCHSEIITKETVVADKVCFIDIRTFIDGDSLGPNKAFLRDALRAWERENKTGIDAVFASLTYGSTPVMNTSSAESVKQSMSTAFTTACEIVASPLWVYCRNTQREELLDTQ
jgi:hypothetical protein